MKIEQKQFEYGFQNEAELAKAIEEYLKANPDGEELVLEIIENNSSHPSLPPESTAPAGPDDGDWL